MPQDIDVINKQVITSVFLLGMVVGGIISILVDSFINRKKGQK